MDTWLRFLFRDRFSLAPFFFTLVMRTPHLAVGMVPPPTLASASRRAGTGRQDPARTTAPSLIPSTLTDSRLILSYRVCFGIPKIAAVA